jgi:hypothetical protein
VVLRSPAPLGSPANAAAIGRLARSLRPLAQVSGVQSPLAQGAGRQLSADRRIGFVVVHFDATAADLPASAVRVITAAAAVMVCVFGSFVVNDPLRILDVFGLGLAVAVLVDSTVIRMVLVPAVMQLLGSANWWLPRWLGRAIPSLAIESSAVLLPGDGPACTRPVSAEEPGPGTMLVLGG